MPENACCKSFTTRFSLTLQFFLFFPIYILFGGFDFFLLFLSAFLVVFLAGLLGSWLHWGNLGVIAIFGFSCSIGIAVHDCNRIFEHIETVRVKSSGKMGSIHGEPYSGYKFYP